MLETVLIVEDHPLVAEATKELLVRSADSLAVVICYNATQALSQLNRTEEKWFRILLDLDVPGAYGLSLTKQVSLRGLQDRCCVVTALRNPQYISELDRQGFLGYIMKATPIEEFTRSLHSIIEGKRVYPKLGQSARTSPVRLTRRQTQLLDCVKRGMLSKQIAFELGISEGTVNNQINNALKVLNVATRSQGVVKAIELGLIGMLDLIEQN